MIDQDVGTRGDRRLAYALERRAVRSGRWGEWRRTDLPMGGPGNGWLRQVRVAFANDLYAVLVRPVQTHAGVVQHCAIRTASNLEPPWRDKQRIKNELFGEGALAIEVMPSEANLVDAADMYHIWVLPTGSSFEFGLGQEECLASLPSHDEKGTEDVG